MNANTRRGDTRSWAYLKVAEQLRVQILSGRYRPGKRLPGEIRLAKQFGVGRVTVSKALEVLEKEGLIFRVKGGGTYVQRSVLKGTVRLVIGYLVGDASMLTNTAAGLILAAAQSELESAGHRFKLMCMSEVLEGTSAWPLRRQVNAGSIHGIIVGARLETSELRAIRSLLPTVVVLHDNVPPGVDFVPVDFTWGYFCATRHLLDLGHRKIGLLGGSPHGSFGYRALQAFRLALRLMEVDPNSCPVRLCGWRTDNLKAAAEDLLTAYPDLTALVCADDTAALIALQVASRLGRRVPEDLSLVGFNDMPVAASLNPPLTTLRVDFSEVGRQAVRLVLARIRGEEVGPPQYLMPELVVRESTAKPKVL